MAEHLTEMYWRKVISLYETIVKEESNSIAKAAELLASAIEKDQLIHVIGPGGHSNMGAEEMFYRAGGLVPVNAILDPGTILAMGARRSTIIERTPGYGVSVLNAYNVNDGAMVIVNAYGINAMCIDVALESKRRGVPTVGITSREFAEKTPPDHPARHSSKANLCDVVDVHVDCHMPFGDAVVYVEEIGKSIGPVSTLVNLFTLNLIVVKTVELLTNKQVEVPIWTSANIPGGDEANKAYLEKYMPRIKLL